MYWIDISSTCSKFARIIECVKCILYIYSHWTFGPRQGRNRKNFQGAKSLFPIFSLREFRFFPGRNFHFGRPLCWKWKEKVISFYSGWIKYPIICCFMLKSRLRRLILMLSFNYRVTMPNVKKWQSVISEPSVLNFILTNLILSFAHGCSHYRTSKY